MHLLLLFVIASGVMRNDLFVFKIFIPTPYCGHKKKRTLTELTTRCHSLSLVVTCRHALSLVTSCHSLYHSLSFVVISLVCLFIIDPRKTSKDQKKTLHVLYKKSAQTKLKMFKENVESFFSKFNP